MWQIQWFTPQKLIKFDGFAKDLTFAFPVNLSWNLLSKLRML